MNKIPYDIDSSIYALSGEPCFTLPEEDILKDRILEAKEEEYSRLMREYEGFLETGNYRAADNLRICLKELEDTIEN